LDSLVLGRRHGGGEAKVCKARIKSPVEEDVRGLDIVVEDAAHPVQMHQPARRVAYDPHALPPRQWRWQSRVPQRAKPLLAVGRAQHAVLKGAAHHQRKDEAACWLAEAVPEQGQYVRVLTRTEQLYLVLRVLAAVHLHSLDGAQARLRQRWKRGLVHGAVRARGNAVLGVEATSCQMQLVRPQLRGSTIQLARRGEFKVDAFAREDRQGRLLPQRLGVVGSLDLQSRGGAAQ
jgi:hypothetical protein